MAKEKFDVNEYLKRLNADLDRRLAQVGSGQAVAHPITDRIRRRRGMNV